MAESARPTRTTSTTRRARAAVASVAVVTALVAGACASSDSASTAGGSSAGTAAKPAGGGWADCPEPCSFSEEPSSASGGAYESGSLEDDTLRGESSVSTTTAPGPRDADSGAPAAPPATQVTAGSVDDNEDWDEYLRYRQEFDAKGIPIDPIVVEGRQVFTVTDAEGFPVVGATIEVRDGAGAVAATLKTYSDGRALFHPATAADPTSQQRPRYTATVSKGGVSEQVELRAETRAYDVRLDTTAPAAPVALDVVFLIDTTGSMGDEIDRLKANITSMAEKIATLPVAPDVRYGMTLYRDRGDLFETRTFDLTADQVAFGAALDEVQADGGGDTPEDLNAGLRDAVDKQSWRGDDAVKLVFVVADAPPHLDYAGSPSYAATALDAAARGIKVLPIGASGLDPQGEYVMRQLAQVTLGRFVFLTYGVAGGPGESTPMEVERDQYSVLPLDELVVQLVADELEPLQR